jgi:hypothetical protein
MYAYSTQVDNNFPKKKRICKNIDIDKEIRTSWLTCICSLVPAVMFDIVQQASFLMLFLWLYVNKLKRQGSAPWLIINSQEKTQHNKENQYKTKKEIGFGQKMKTENCNYVPFDSIINYFNWLRVTTWVWLSSPVTIFPTVRTAGINTEVDRCLK